MLELEVKKYEKGKPFGGWLRTFRRRRLLAAAESSSCAVGSGEWEKRGTYTQQGEGELSYQK